MAASGTITIGGKQYTWESITVDELEHFEATIGPVTDPAVLNSIKARKYLAYLCLKKHHPDITVGIIGTWDNDDFTVVWGMVLKAVPFLRHLFGLAEVRLPDQSSDSQTDSSGSSSASQDGDPQTPDGSA